MRVASLLSDTNCSIKIWSNSNTLQYCICHSSEMTKSVQKCLTPVSDWKESFWMVVLFMYQYRYLIRKIKLCICLSICCKVMMWLTSAVLVCSCFHNVLFLCAVFPALCSAIGSSLLAIKTKSWCPVSTLGRLRIKVMIRLSKEWFIVLRWPFDVV